MRFSCPSGDTPGLGVLSLAPAANAHHHQTFTPRGWGHVAPWRHFPLPLLSYSHLHGLFLLLAGRLHVGPSIN